MISAARVGEQSDVEWKLVYRSPALAMRSMAGVGITPPKVLGAPKPWSSVMISSTLGAPFGGTMRGGHQGGDSEAFSLITPPKLAVQAEVAFRRSWWWRRANKPTRDLLCDGRADKSG